MKGNEMAKCNNGESPFCNGKVTRRDELGMCSECFEFEGLRNEHSDNGGHNEFEPNCPDCIWERNQTINRNWMVVFAPLNFINLFEGRKFAQFPVNTNSRILAVI